MLLPKKKPAWWASLLLPLVMLVGCASASKTPPEPVREIQLTPLPASVRSIPSTNSADWRLKAQNWLLKLDTFSQKETSTLYGSETK